MKKLVADNHARHGDINFASCEKLDRSTKIVKSFVLAEGEHTGHFHRLTAGKNGSIAVLENEDVSYFEIVGEDAVLDHPEHGPIGVKVGTYRVWKERERDPFLDSIREVRD